MGMSDHTNPVMLKDEWLTPPDLLKNLGWFDLDPCAPIKRPWDTAQNHFTIEDDGLNQPWKGRVWCNPPYGKEAGKWLARMAEHENGLALIFARTETKTFFSEVWNKAAALLFIEGRLHFHHVNGDRANSNSGAPSVLIAYSYGDAKCLRECGIKGKYLHF